MARLTKNSYKRKIIVFGLLVFMSIALMSTGFAAWVMSQGDKESQDGNVSVGVVEDGRVALNQVKFTPVVWGYNEDYSELVELTGNDYELATQDGLNFKFEPLFNDNNGAITWEGIQDTGINCEILEIKVSGLVTNHHLLDDGVLNIELEVSKGVKDCIENQYINIPEGFEFKKVDGVEYTNESGKYVLIMNVEPSSSGLFNFTVKFSWGSAFNNANPAGTTNDNSETTATQLDELKNKIEIFRALLYGYYDNNTDNCLSKINEQLVTAYDNLNNALQLDYSSEEAKEAAISSIQNTISLLENQKATLINSEYNDSYKLTIIAATEK